jgi:chromosome segregation ATPase
MWIMILVAVAFAAVPAAWAQKEQARNIEDMTQFREQVQAVRDQIDPVLNSLNAIVQNASANPTASFKTFSKEMDEMDDQVDKARKMRADMQKRGQDLFKEWEKKMGTITNPDIKAAAEANRAKLQELYKSIEPDITAAKDTGNAFLADPKDLNAYFQVDLSSGGIASVSSQVTKCNSDGKAVQGMLDKVLSTVDQVKAQMAPGGTRQPKN